MAVIEIARIQVRRGQEHETGVPQLEPGEFGWAEDTQNLYIGKRVSEGANSDDNARILTDKDLQNIFNLIEGSRGLSGSVASTSTYRYRDDLPFSQFRSTTTTIAKKLDATVNLHDFTQEALTDGTDITDVLTRAIQDIYTNEFYGTSTVRILEIPAGDFRVSSVVDLPPYTHLRGEGPGITSITLTNNATNLFRTVDGLGNDFSVTMQTGEFSSKYVTLEDMTLAYKKDNVNTASLITIDNCEKPTINNIEFTTKDANISTSTYVSTGTAITVRGNLGSDLTGSIAHSSLVQDCVFKNIERGVNLIGRVSGTKISNSTFNYLKTGIRVSSFHSDPTNKISQNTLVTENRFQDIRGYAIHTTQNDSATNLISRENVFRTVGNLGTIADKNITQQKNPIFKFESMGNTSINDRFNRREVSVNSAPGFYYNPIASQYAKIENTIPENVTLAALTDNQEVCKIPLTGFDQIALIEYQIVNDNMSRKGTLTVNISSDNFASVSDYYNYSEVVDATSELLAFSTDTTNEALNYISVVAYNFDEVETTMEYTITIMV